jgi:hypothetical protein
VPSDAVRSHVGRSRPGSSLRDEATLGWDYATGLGSPIGTPLADAIVAYLKTHPASS